MTFKRYITTLYCQKFKYKTFKLTNKVGTRCFIEFNFEYYGFRKTREMEKHSKLEFVYVKKKIAKYVY